MNRLVQILTGLANVSTNLERKGWWKSKTVWIQLFSLAATGAALVFGEDLGITVTDTEAAAVAAVNLATIVARWNGEQALAAKRRQS